MKEGQVIAIGSVILLLGTVLVIVGLEENSSSSSYIERIKAECLEYSKKAKRNVKNETLALALSKCKEALDGGADDEKTLLALGEAHIKNGDYLNAYLVAESGIKVHPEYSDLYWLKGIIFSLNHNHERAITAFERAIELNPKDYESLKNIGISLRELERYEEAKSIFMTYIEGKPNDATGYVALGNVLYNMKAHKDTEVVLKKALSIKADYDLAYQNLCNLYYNTIRFSKAIDNCTKSISLNPSNYASYSLLAFIHTEKGNYQSAIEFFNSALKINPDNPQLLHSIRELERKLIETNNSKLLTSEVFTASKRNRQKDYNKELLPVLNSVVRIMNKGIFPTEALGTGWIFAKKGTTAYVLTNRHIVTGRFGGDTKKNLQIELFSIPTKGQLRKRLSAKLLYIPPKNSLDIAVLEVKNIPSGIVPLSISQEKPGATAIMSLVGHPINSQPWDIRSGDFLGEKEDKESGLALLFNIPISKGHSGAPVLNSDMEVVGIVTHLQAPLPNEDIDSKSLSGLWARAEKMDLVLRQLQKWGF